MSFVFPTDLAQITPGLITQILHENQALAGAKVTYLRTESVTGEVSFHAQIVRLWLTYDQPAAAAPRSLIVKLPTRDVSLRATAAVFRPGAKETWFYRRIAPRNQLAAPRCYYSADDPTTGESVLLLEDLATAQRISHVTGVSAEAARLALRALAALHARWWRLATALEMVELQTIEGPGEAGANLVERLYAEGWPQFVARGVAPIPPEVRCFGDRLVGRLIQAEALLDEAAQTLIHGDFRLDNMLFTLPSAAPTCWLLDWEDVSFASPAIDLTWFLGGCLPLANSHQEELLLRFYHSCLVAGGVTDYTGEQCQRDYRHALISSFVQGVLSSLVDDNAGLYQRQFAQAMASRFIAACQRWQLGELLETI
jgi:hypothetical protein